MDMDMDSAGKSCWAQHDSINAVVTQMANRIVYRISSISLEDDRPRIWIQLNNAPQSHISLNEVKSMISFADYWTRYVDFEVWLYSCRSTTSMEHDILYFSLLILSRIIHVTRIRYKKWFQLHVLSISHWCMQRIDKIGTMQNWNKRCMQTSIRDTKLSSHTVIYMIINYYIVVLEI